MITALTTQVKELLSAPKNCVIIGHKNPDGDAVGSCLGLDLYLKSIGQKSQVVMPNDFPDFLNGSQAPILFLILKNKTHKPF